MEAVSFEAFHRQTRQSKLCPASRMILRERLPDARTSPGDRDDFALKLRHMKY
jgi:hypothetical protein